MIGLRPSEATMTTESQHAPAPPDENQIVAERRAKLSAIRAAGIAFPNDVRPADRAADLLAAFALSLSGDDDFTP